MVSALIFEIQNLIYKCVEAQSRQASHSRKTHIMLRKTHIMLRKTHIMLRKTLGEVARISVTEGRLTNHRQKERILFLTKRY